MTQLYGYNDIAIDYYLSGKGGEIMRRMAEQELYERGKQSASNSENETIRELLDYIARAKQWFDDFGAHAPIQFGGEAQMYEEASDLLAKYDAAGNVPESQS